PAHHALPSFPTRRSSDLVSHHPLRGRAVLGLPSPEVFAVEQHDRVGRWRHRRALGAQVDDRRTGSVQREHRPLLRRRAQGTANQRQERQLPQLVHGFHVPLATAGTNVSSPLGGNSSVFPCSALMYAVISSFTTSTPSSKVSSGCSHPRNTLTKCRSSAS